MKFRRDIKSLWQELELQSSMREHIFQPCCNYSSTDHSGRHAQNPMTVASAYKELGLSTDASIEDVKAAYRRLALKCHPDLQRKDGTEFLRISTAYQKILNKRRVNSVPGGTARSQSPYVRAYPGNHHSSNQESMVCSTRLSRMVVQKHGSDSSTLQDHQLTLVAVPLF
jgi:hypothetical protein